MVSTDITTIEKKHTMLRSIKKFLQGIFNQPNDFEAYIASKNPQSPAEVDHWARIYSRRSDSRYGF
jgi:hypothetical protein